MPQHWKFNLWRNAATNYLKTSLRLVTGLILFRLLFQHFSEEQFGYWALLWSVFGATVLLDFGMGSAAQRETAYCVAHQQWDKLSRLMSTMVWTFALIGGLILLICLVAQPYFLGMIHVSPENTVSFSRAYWIFFGALALSFPAGLFMEMLAGCQRLDLANWTMIASYLVNLALIYTGVVFNWSMEGIVTVGVLTSLTPNLVAFFLVRRLLPDLRISIAKFDFPSVRGVLSFSVVAYIITLTNIIITRTDQAVISVCLGVALVAVYQAGYKVAEVFSVGTQQIQRALSPAAAHLRAKGDKAGLVELVTKTTRLTVLIAVPAYALGVTYLEPLICLVTGLKALGITTFLVAHCLLLATFSFLLTSSCSKQILVMAGWERPLLKWSIAEAALNLVLSVALALKFGIVGVAAGTLVPAVLVGWFGILRLTLRFTGMSLSQWVQDVFSSVLRPVSLSLAVLGLIVWFWPISPTPHLFRIAVRGVLVMLPVLLFAYQNRRRLF